MPKIKITEYDKTGRIQNGAISNIVYIPIRFNSSASGAQVSRDSINIPAAFKDITLFTSAEQFINAANAKVLTGAPITIFSFDKNLRPDNSADDAPAGWTSTVDMKFGTGSKGNGWETASEINADSQVEFTTTLEYQSVKGIKFDARLKNNSGATFSVKVGNTLIKTFNPTEDEVFNTYECTEADFASYANLNGKITIVAQTTATCKIIIDNVEINSLTGGEQISCIDNNSLGYKLCVHLLNIGYQILVEALTDGSEPNFKALEDKNLYDVRFITLGVPEKDLTDSDLKTHNQHAIELAAKRGDCVALLSINEDITDFDYSISNIRDEFDFTNLLTNGEDAVYAAAFTPWFYTKHSDFRDSEYDTKKNEYVQKPFSKDFEGVKIPAAFGYLFAYANSIKNNPEWYAVAGFERGVIPELLDVCHVYTTADVEVLQARAKDKAVELDDDNDNVGFAINPICYVRPAGYILYGNRTLKDNDKDKKTTAQSFLNIRNGVSAIKKVMYEASRKYTFEQNTETLWINFQSYITPLLDRMQSGNGILGYTFVRQKTDAKARLKAKLNIVPIEAVEDFELEVYLTDDLTVSE